ncbi:DUF4760 domain-containing protein [Acinetobacter radioresistens]|uniref:DUF4760 domain-containing protein n=1 Tax=Acinetobacter radioresistens TaxID=40216 RepID=UPI000DAC2CC9|nr:DUF4760 domain-containing protein [Acinetobacter radioresistens]AWV87048.1 DUF4760 domain-containing protein [Acinetobacter radioresistens]MCX0328922.1 DUF4760 domain-containing protein [Acinetobacter radioresistens]
MASNTPQQILKGRLTFLLALSAFLIALYLVRNDIFEFINLKEWKTNDWLAFSQLIVFLVSAYIAYTTIHSSKNTSRERATLDTILDDNKDETLFNSKMIVLRFDEDPSAYFLELEDKESNHKSLASLLSVAESALTINEAEVRMHLLKVLNRYEFYAIGINRKLLDEEMFKRMYCSTMLKFWAICSPAVSQLRETAKKDTLFKEFECLANRWKTNPLKVEDIN